MDDPVVQFGFDTLGGVAGPPDNRITPHSWVIREAVQEAVLADKLEPCLTRHGHDVRLFLQGQLDPARP